jgi:uncharacterized membrane-anchored protein
LSNNPLQLRQMLNKVPEVTIFFWIIKILCTTVGETAADYLNETLHFGLTGTSIVCGALLVVVLFLQFRTKKYIPTVYWSAVVLISVVGTLITDNLTDGFGVALTTTTTVFSVLLLATFVAWYLSEKTLSVHSIYTTRREVFYWLTILFTFALGTAAGDLIAEKWDLGYLTAVGIFASAIVVVTAAHFIIKAALSVQHKHQSTNAVLGFWVAYVLTRPLGGSIGDLLSSDRGDGGLGLGTTATSAVFLTCILALVIYLTLTHKDEIKPDAMEPGDAEHAGGAQLPVADPVLVAAE